MTSVVRVRSDPFWNKLEICSKRSVFTDRGSFENSFPRFWKRWRVESDNVSNDKKRTSGVDTSVELTSTRSHEDTSRRWQTNRKSTGWNLRVFLVKFISRPKVKGECRSNLLLVTNSVTLNSSEIRRPYMSLPHQRGPEEVDLVEGPSICLSSSMKCETSLLFDGCIRVLQFYLDIW